MKKQLITVAVLALLAGSIFAEREPLPSGFIKTLLHLGANYNTDALSAKETNDIDKDYLADYGGQANQKPYPGVTYALESKDFVWTVITNTASDGIWKTSPNKDNFVKYWHVYIYSPDAAARAARITYRHDDDIAVWLNGTRVFKTTGWDNNNNKTHDFTLAPGQNSFTIKLREGSSGDVMGFQITDRSGTAFTDLTYGFYPELASVPVPGIGQITADSATFTPGFENNTGAEMTIYALCSTNDWGTSLADWQAYGEVASATVSAPAALTVTGLQESTLHYARFCVVSYGKEIWSAPATFSTFGNAPAITSDPVQNLTGSTADLPATLHYAGGLDAATVTLYWGLEDGGTDEGEWDEEVPLGAKTLGAMSYPLETLMPYTNYFYRHKAEIAGGISAWSAETQSFVVPGAPALGAVETVPQLANRLVVINGELLDIGGAATTVQCYFGTDADNLAVVAEWANLNAPQTFTHTQDDLAANTYYYYALRAFNTIGGTVYETWTATNALSFGIGKVWTGAAGDSDWSNPDNWDGGLPGATDTAIFTNDGLAANQVIALSATQTIYSLQIDATRSFTIGSAADKAAPFPLTLSELATPETGGGTYTFGTQLAHVTDNSPATSVWHVASGTMRLTAGSTTASGVSVMKTGTGKVEFNGGTFHSGTTIIAEGSASATANLGGHLVVGTPDGTVAASYSGTSQGPGVPSGKNITVYANGTYYQGDWPNSSALTIYGGRVNGNWPNFNGDITMKGGLLTASPLQGTYRNIITLSNDTPATVSSTVSFDGYTGGQVTFNVADGTAPVDLKITGTVENNHSSSTARKIGAGTMQLTSNWNKFNKTSFNINGGTVLVDNTSGTGTGNANVNINTGATLGGVGFIAGTENAAAALVTVAGSNASTLSTVAPGTVDADTGAHIIGTLTVGSETYTNNIAFNNYSRLSTTIGRDYAHDKLTVHGTITISATGSVLNIETHEKTKPGAYTLARASEGVTGEFASVVINGEIVNRFVTYTDTEIVYDHPFPGTIFIVK